MTNRSTWRSLFEPASVEATAWVVGLFALTALLVAVRAYINQAHIILAYLLVVQAGSARGGRPLGVTLAAAAFLCFAVYFLPRVGILGLADPLDWLVLDGFLAASLLSAQLLYRAQAEAEVARRRAAEIDRLSTLGAETLNVARAEDALAAIVEVIRVTLNVDECAVYINGAGGTTRIIGSTSSATPDLRRCDPLVERVSAEGRSIAERVDGTLESDAAAMMLVAAPTRPQRTRCFVRPLQVRGVTVGVLLLGKADGFSLVPAELPVLGALAYYTALGVERMRLEEAAECALALQEAHRAKDALLVSVSHDLRTPLTTIRALAHEIARDGDDRARVIEAEANRLNRFVTQMLDLSRIASGTAVSDVRVNDAEDLLGAAAQQVAGRLDGRELRIQVDSSDELLLGRFDFAQTLRALVNLIENATKYSPPLAPIEVTARRTGEWLKFAVADRGRGVPESERERIFEPFYRLASAEPDVGGVGLGLSIARGIAEAQGGSVVWNDRDGGGSTFTLRVPTAPAEEADRRFGGDLSAGELPEDGLRA